MRKAILIPLLALAALIAAIVVIPRFIKRKTGPSLQELVEAHERTADGPNLTILYPRDGTVFPSESIAPIFQWQRDGRGSDAWIISVRYHDDRRMHFTSDETVWKPTETEWTGIKRDSKDKPATVTILGRRHAQPQQILSSGTLTLMTSSDEVGAPIFYREVNLPFREAVKDPTRIRWRMGSIDSKQQPPIVLDNLPVCGNCHSFSRKGDVLGMDVDYANDKGSYAIAPVKSEITLGKKDIITWSDYKREDKKQTFGLLSQVSPDGRYVVSTVKDRSVFVPRDNLAYSQLFFPIRGILAVHDTETGAIRGLPGADDPQYVQSNPTWSPDGKYIVFARSKAYYLLNEANTRKALLTKDECVEFLKDEKPFLFDLYRIPFNDGKGGKAEPLAGASNNGKSNFFAKYSPDGKWIVFCRARSYMLLQPDATLYIIPSAGGEARRMRCNNAHMNSWHSWSPNSRWLVFSSKANGPYTQLFITHIDENGRSAPAMLLSQFTSPDRAANIPEFLFNSDGAIESIRERFVDDHSYIRAANEYIEANEPENAARMYEKALEMNPKNVEAHNSLGILHLQVGRRREAMACFQEALKFDPNHAQTYFILGLVMQRSGRIDEAIANFSKGLENGSEDYSAHNSLAQLLIQKKRFKESEAHMRKAAKLQPYHAATRNNLGTLLLQRGNLAEAERQFEQAVRLQKEFPQGGDVRNTPYLRMRFNQNPAYKPAVESKIDLRTVAGFCGLSAGHAEAGNLKEAIRTAQRALTLARELKNEELIKEIETKIEAYRSRKASGRARPNRPTD